MTILDRVDALERRVAAVEARLARILAPRPDPEVSPRLPPDVEAEVGAELERATTADLEDSLAGTVEVGAEPDAYTRQRNPI